MQLPADRFSGDQAVELPAVSGRWAPLPSPLATVAVNLDGLRAVLRGDLDLARLGVLGGQRPNPLRSTATPTRAFLPLARPPMRPG
jgi:hypothetical protein